MVKPSVVYESHTVSVKDCELPTISLFTSDQIQKTNLCVEDFRSLLWENEANGNLQVFQILAVSSNKDKNIISKDIAEKRAYNNKQLEYVLNQYIIIFRDDLPDGLPPQRSLNHSITTDENETLPHRGVFQVSSAEHLVTK